MLLVTIQGLVAIFARTVLCVCALYFWVRKRHELPMAWVVLLLAASWGTTAVVQAIHLSGYDGEAFRWLLTIQLLIAALVTPFAVVRASKWVPSEVYDELKRKHRAAVAVIRRRGRRR